MRNVTWLDIALFAAVAALIMLVLVGSVLAASIITEGFSESVQVAALVTCLLVTRATAWLAEQLMRIYGD